MALHFNCCPTQLEEDQVLDYLHFLQQQSRKPSSSYLKHTVYGLRLAYKVTGVPSKQVFLPKMKLPKKLPVVLSQTEVFISIRKYTSISIQKYTISFKEEREMIVLWGTPENDHLVRGFFCFFSFFHHLLCFF
nr:hypothetical protein [uncultured Carboxylicivirga sp.]